jgi:hypothetical protein
MGSFSLWHWLIVLLMLLPGVLYLLSLQRAMEAVDAELRPMPPGLVWLLLFPLVNIVWMFFVVTNLKTGYTKMGAAGRLTAASDAGYGVGLALAICMAISILPLIGGLALLPVLVLWIIHWVMVSKARGLVKPGGQAAISGP